MEQPIYAIQLAEDHGDRFFMVLLRKHEGNVTVVNHFVDKDEDYDCLEKAVIKGLKDIYNVEN